MAQRGKIANSLVAVSSAAVMAVYAAGYVRTRSAADRLEGQTEARRPAPPKPPEPAVLPLVAVAETTPIPAPVVPAATAPVTPVKEAPAAVETPVSETPSVPEPTPAATAPAPEPPPPPPPPAPPTPVWKDGTYTGWGTSRHGDIQASVVIEGGKIASATIAQCLTRYSCSVIDRLPPEVPQRQSAEVDYISGATQSTNAFYYAVVEALGKAK
jgi:uncharacterized protein with FMN-binding domain